MKIDLWTIGLQAFNILVLLWLLQRFLYRPVQQILEERRKLGTSLIEQARQSEIKLGSERAALAQQRAELAAVHDKALAEAQTAAAAERRQQLTKVEAEVAERTKAATKALQAERLAAEAALTDEAASLAIDITRRLLLRQPEAIALNPFLREACAELKRTSRSGRCGAGDEVEVVITRMPGDDEQARFREDLQAALGYVPRIRFSVDPALIAGVELRLPDAVIKNHWAQDLATIGDTLRSHAQPA